MLLRHTHMLKFFTALISKLNVANIIWDTKNQKLKLHHSLPKQNLYSIYIKLYMHTILVLVVAIQTFHFIIKPSSQKVSISDKFLYSVSLVMLVPTNFQLWSCNKLPSLHCLYVNGVYQISHFYQQFSKLRKKRKYSLLEKLNLCCVYAIMPSAHIFPIGYLYGLHWFSPCKPSIVGYFFIPECNIQIHGNANVPFLNLFIKLLIFLINHWAWLVSATIAVYVIAGLQILCSLSFGDFVYMVDNMCEFSTKAANYKTCLVYRSVQILNGLANEVQKDIFMLVIMCTTVFMYAVAMTGISLVPWTSNNVISLACFMSMVIYDLILILTMLGGMANIYQDSQRLLRKQRKIKYISSSKIIPKLVKHSETQAFYLSCSPIRFKFGELNFVDRLTPLNCTVFAQKVTLQFHLLSGRLH